MSFPDPDDLARVLTSERKSLCQHTGESHTHDHGKLIQKSVRAIDRGFRTNRLNQYSTPEEAHEHAMKSVSGIILWWIGREIVSQIFWFVVNRIFQTYVNAKTSVGHHSGSE